MTTYTPEKFRQALKLSGYTHWAMTDEEARDAMILLGLEVEDPKPEPGIYFTKHRDVLIVNTNRGNSHPDTLWIIGNGGDNKAYQVNVEQPDHTMHPLTPARVVPADKPQPISRTRAAYLYEQVSKQEGTLPSFYDLSDGVQFAILGLIDSAIRSYVETGQP